MQVIVGSIDPRHTKIVAAMTEANGLVLPKTTTASKERPLVVLETRKAMCFGCR